MSLSQHLRKFVHIHATVPNHVKTLLPASLTAFQAEHLKEKSKLIPAVFQTGLTSSRKAENSIATEVFISGQAGNAPFLFVNNTSNKSSRLLSFGQTTQIPTYVPHLRKEIIDPKKHLIIEIDKPDNGMVPKDITLPSVSERELLDPTEHIVEKQAVTMIVIRRKKMKKHKLKKRLRKDFYSNIRVNQARELKKEKEYQKTLLEQCRKGEKFEAKKYVRETVEKANWVPPLRVIRGWACPDWVVKQYKKDMARREMIDQRIQDCLNRKK